MKIDYFFKTALFIFVNTLFFFQEAKPLTEEIRQSNNKINSPRKFLLNKSEIKKQNFFTLNQINPVSIFLAFEEKINLPAEKNRFSLESDEQIDTKDSFIAKGNVIIKFKGAILKTNSLKFSKKESILTAEGNIQYQNNNQFIEADKFVYDVLKKKGSIDNVYGLLDIETLTEDLNWESTSQEKRNNLKSEISKTKFESNNIIGLALGSNESNEELYGSSKTEVKLNNLKKWRFQSPKVFVEDELISAKRASFTNDPLNPAQLVLESHNLKSKRKNGKLILISSWTSLNLDNKINIPLARRTIKEDQKNYQKWGFGFDHEDKDGFFLSRNSDVFQFSNIKYKLINEIYLQRILEDKTNVFREKGASITSEKVENNIDFGDYFGLKLITNSNLLGYTFNTSTSLNSLNSKRLSEATRFESELEKVLNFKKVKNINNNIFFVYRNKINTGYEGIKEIYSGVGTNFDKDYFFKIKNLDINSNLRIQLANFTSEELNGKNLMSHNRLSAVALFENRYKIWEYKNPDSYINNSYKYTPLINDQGVDWVSRLTLNNSLYNNHNSQNFIKFEIGPELQLGEFKQKTFDFTKFKAFLGLYSKNGDSPFKFDNINESERIYLELKQQIYGPLVFEAKGHLNIDRNSDKYNHFINPKYSLSINRRAYNFEIYTIPERNISGFNFNIFGLGYDGYGKRFKDNF